MLYLLVLVNADADANALPLEWEGVEEMESLSASLLSCAFFTIYGLSGVKRGREVVKGVYGGQLTY